MNICETGISNGVKSVDDINDNLNMHDIASWVVEHSIRRIAKGLVSRDRLLIEEYPDQALEFNIIPTHITDDIRKYETVLQLVSQNLYNYTEPAYIPDELYDEVVELSNRYIRLAADILANELVDITHN